MNMLTNYLDMKYKRTYKTRRKIIKLEPVARDLYYTVVGNRKRNPISIPEIEYAVPYLLINPSMITLAECENKLCRVRKTLSQLSALDEFTKLRRIIQENSLCDISNQTDIPSLFMSIERYLDTMKYLPEIAVEEEEEDFAFI